jgi:hypothetical protein
MQVELPFRAPSTLYPVQALVNRLGYSWLNQETCGGELRDDATVLCSAGTAAPRASAMRVPALTADEILAVAALSPGDLWGTNNERIAGNPR